jgi:hypothetical protein
MLVQLDRCVTSMSGDFSFGSVLCDFFLERVILLWPKGVLDPPPLREPHFMRWGHILSHHGGGEGGYYFMDMFEGV